MGVLLQRAVSSPFLDAALFVERGFGFMGRGKGQAARLACTANATPFAHQAPLTEQIPLHIEPVEAVHVLSAVDAVKNNGGHTDNREIVLWLTL